jgi:hypothetical protein
MAIHFTTASAGSLLKEFDARISQTEAKGKITTWVKSDDGKHYTHYSGPGFLGHEIVLNQVSKEKKHGKGWKPLWCNGGRA